MTKEEMLRLLTAAYTGPGSAAQRAFGSVDNDTEANAQREMLARVRAEFGVE